MLLPKLLGEVDEFKKFSQLIKTKVRAIQRLAEVKGRGWVPTEEEEWGRVRSINLPREFFGLFRTVDSSYMHMPGGYLVELPIVNPKDNVVNLPVSDVMILESPTKVALGTDDFLQSFSSALVSARERAAEETIRRMSHQRRG